MEYVRADEIKMISPALVLFVHTFIYQVLHIVKEKLDGRIGLFYIHIV